MGGLPAESECEGMGRDMFFETHHKMGQLLHDRMERKYPGRINRDAFLYGNVKPDLMRKGARDRHMLLDTAPFLNLTASFLKLPSMEPEEDFVLLGMVCHHICDAFCRYHQEEHLYRAYARHLQYELGLNDFLLGWLQNGLALGLEGGVVDATHPDGFVQPVSESVENASVPYGGNPGVTGLLAPQLARYRAGEPSFYLDLLFALESCCIVMDAILSARFLQDAERKIMHDNFEKVAESSLDNSGKDLYIHRNNQ